MTDVSGGSVQSPRKKLEYGDTPAASSGSPAPPVSKMLVDADVQRMFMEEEERGAESPDMVAALELNPPV